MHGQVEMKKPTRRHEEVRNPKQPELQFVVQNCTKTKSCNQHVFVGVFGWHGKSCVQLTDINPPIHTWTMLCVAGCHGSTHARLATIFGGGVGASAGAGATAARHGAPPVPFGPVTVRHIAVVVEGAPVVGASGG